MILTNNDHILTLLKFHLCSTEALPQSYVFLQALPLLHTITIQRKTCCYFLRMFVLKL